MLDLSSVFLPWTAFRITSSMTTSDWSQEIDSGTDDFHRTFLELAILITNLFLYEKVILTACECGR